MKSIASIALLLAACSSSSQPEASAESRLGESCMSNADCKNEVCAANKICLPSHPAGDGGVTVCGTNADCVMGDQCVVAVCLPGSIPIPDAGALPALPALPDGGVALPGLPAGLGSVCDPAHPCPGALTCLQGFCLPQLCAVDADCTAGKCVQHICQ
jgi:hypothetical protein